MLPVRYILFATIFSYNLNGVISAKILGFFFFPSISHQVVYQSIWKQLAEHGHEVTIISPDILNENLKNLTEIDVQSTYKVWENMELDKGMAKENYMIETVWYILHLFEELLEIVLENRHVKKLLTDEDQKFDVVIVECFHPLVYALGAKYHAPVVGVSSLGGLLHNHDALGNPTHPVLSPDILLNIMGKPTFLDRLQSAFYNVWYRMLYYGYFLPQADKLARKYFGNDIPYLGELERNVSLLLLNTNPILHPIRANVPTIIELGQMHIKPKKPLPKDLQKLLDESPEGVVYFSLGSNVKSANLTVEVRNTIIDALAELPYKVIWKWETDYLPGKPKNVITRKWLPQQDILGHPNVKVFITQGGLQSMEEAVINRVPLVGMPFFADQPLNVMKMVQKGIAEKVDHVTMTKDVLKAVIMKVATTPIYQENIDKIRSLMVDQPMSGKERAVWWIEYVIRHKGAHHLRGDAAIMPWYQYFLLDVLGFTLVVSSTVIYIGYLIMTYLLRSSNQRKKVKSL